MKKKISEVVIYQAKNGAIELKGDFGHETIWATLDQIANVFGRDKSVISRHLKKIYAEKELDEKSTVAKNATVQKEGMRQVERMIEYYNLDAIVSVGYRVNSKTATEFRKWATKTLREHITQGYTINRSVIGKNYDAFMKVVGDIQTLLPEHVALDPDAILGDGASYYLGTKGTGLFHNKNRWLKVGYLEGDNRFFRKHGSKSIFFGASLCLFVRLCYLWPVCL